jgi:hypothetical protein
MAFADAVAVTPIRLVERAATSIVTTVTPDGTNGNRFSVNRRTLLRVKNTNGATRTVTVNVTKLRDGLALPDVTFTVAATTGDVIWYGFESIFEQDDTGEAHITFSAVTDVTIQVIQLPA